jgi:hypothetical protein
LQRPFQYTSHPQGANLGFSGTSARLPPLQITKEEETATGGAAAGRSLEVQTSNLFSDATFLSTAN